MNFYIALIAALSLFTAGWFGHSAYSDKDLAHAIEKAHEQYIDAKAKQEAQRKSLEEQNAKDRYLAESRLQKALTENAQLRAEADALVSIELLIYGRLCDNSQECAVLYRYGTDQAHPAPQGNIAISAREIYQTLAILDQQTLETNLRMEQLTAQLKSCR